MRRLYATDNCKFNGNHFLPSIAIIPQVVFATAPATNDNNVWITSANDSKHMAGSKHYANEAFDFRIHNVLGGKVAVDKWVSDIKGMLGRKYDVVLEIDHIHVEYDPK